jgi:hypothetical protein
MNDFENPSMDELLQWVLRELAQGRAVYDCYGLAGKRDATLMLFRYEDHGKEKGYSLCGPKDREETFKYLSRLFDLIVTAPKEARADIYKDLGEALRTSRDKLDRLALGRYVLRMRETLGIAAYEDLTQAFSICVDKSFLRPWATSWITRDM